MYGPGSAQRLQTLRILWAAFCGTPMIFAVVGVTYQPEAPPDEVLLSYGIAALAAPMTIAVFVVPRVLMRGGRDPYTATIIRFALLEAISIFGLVALMIGAPTWVGVAPIVWGFLLTLAHFPGARTVEPMV